MHFYGPRGQHKFNLNPSNPGAQVIMSSSSYKVFWNAEKQASSVSYDAENNFNNGGVRRKATGRVGWWILAILLLSLGAVGGFFCYSTFLKSEPLPQPLQISSAPLSQEPSVQLGSNIPAQFQFEMHDAAVTAMNPQQVPIIPTPVDGSPSNDSLGSSRDDYYVDVASTNVVDAQQNFADRI